MTELGVLITFEADTWDAGVTRLYALADHQNRAFPRSVLFCIRLFGNGCRTPRRERAAYL